MAVVPVPLTLPAIKHVAQVSIKATLKPYPGATFKVGFPTKAEPKGCRRTAARYGQCTFYVVGHFNEQAKGLQKCSGLVQIRNIGKGFEHRLIVKGCVSV